MLILIVGKDIEEMGYRNINDRTNSDILFRQYMSGMINTFDFIYFGF